MKIYLVRGYSGYESSWNARAFTCEQDAINYRNAATEQAKAKIQENITIVPEEIDGETVQTEVVITPQRYNWATLLDPNFYFDGCNPGDFHYSISEPIDLIG